MKEDTFYRLYGRIIRKNNIGNILFFDIHTYSGKYQVIFEKNSCNTDIFNYAKTLKVGDVISLRGEKYTTKRGTESILATDFQCIMRTKSNNFVGIKKSKHQLYKERCMELATNEEKFEYYKFTSRLIFELRKALYDRDFLEFDTGILRSTYDGGLSEPYETYSKGIGKKLYLRPTMEIRLKELLAAGYEKIFEIGRVFRNSGYNRKTSPEFTLLECYKTFTDYKSMEKLLEEIVKESLSKTVEKYKKYKKEASYILEPWKRISFFEIRNESDKKMPKEENKYDTIKKYIKNTVIPQIKKPTIIADMPLILFPLAKAQKTNPSVAEASILIIDGEYIADIYTDENDPKIIKDRLIAQSRIKNAPINQHFIDVLKFGIPPSSGFGLGINRLLLTLRGNVPKDIRDTFIFRPLT